MLRRRAEGGLRRRIRARSSPAELLAELAGSSPRNRGALAQSRAALAIAARALRQLEIRARAARREPPGGFGPATEALFDLVAQSDLLGRVAPGGKVPRDFARRCLTEARRRAGALEAEKAALALGDRLYTNVAQDLAARNLGVRLRTVVRLARSYPGEPEEGLGAGWLPIPGTALAVDGRGHVRLRPTIPGSGIVIGETGAERSDLRLGRPALRRGSTRAPTSSRSAARDEGPPKDSFPASAALRTRGSEGALFPAAASLHLGKALAVIDAAWPEAGRLLRERTRLVIPCDEPGLVSYSLASRPGVSFLNLRGKRLIDLADDLLHETAHHVLHDVEARAPLVAPGRPQAGQDEPRVWSPWRRAQRPARGILHACFTFAYRAELLGRIRRAARASGGRAGPLRVSAALAVWLGRESRKERRWIRSSLDELMRTCPRGVLTRAGRRLMREMLRVEREPASRGGSPRRAALRRSTSSRRCPP